MDEVAAKELGSLLEAELATPVLGAVAAMADAIRARHGDAVAAVLFYGSCLRKRGVEGVLDFYVIVDDYVAAYGGRRWLAWLNRALPPNVFYVEHDHAGERLRAKYAVFSSRDFAARAIGGPDARVWARFSQPSRLVYARDARARDDVLAAVVAATRTAVGRMIAWQPGEAARQTIDPHALWTHGFRETYGSELRGEGGATIDALYAGAAARFDRVARLVLASDPRFRLAPGDGAIEVESDPAWRARSRREWATRRRVAKAVTVLGLFKTSLTFDDWVSYALWKIERHSGKPVEITERQRRHPFLFAWPVIFRLLRERVLR